MAHIQVEGGQHRNSTGFFGWRHINHLEFILLSYEVLAKKNGLMFIRYGHF